MQIPTNFFYLFLEKVNKYFEDKTIDKRKFKGLKYQIVNKDKQLMGSENSSGNLT